MKALSEELEAATSNLEDTAAALQEHKEALSVVRESLRDARDDVLSNQTKASNSESRALEAEERAAAMEMQLSKRGTAMEISQRRLWDRDLRAAIERAVAAAKKAWSHSLEAEARSLRATVARLSVASADALAAEQQHSHDVARQLESTFREES